MRKALGRYIKFCVLYYIPIRFLALLWRFYPEKVKSITLEWRSILATRAEKELPKRGPR